MRSFPAITMGGVSAALAVVFSSVVVGDAVRLPPEVRTVRSENGVYELRLKRPAELRKGRFPTAKLCRVSDAGSQTTRWQQHLDFYVGPRFMFVTNDGVVVLVDEWLRKVDTPNAVTGFGPDGNRMYRYSLDDIKAKTGLSWSKIESSATEGAWLSEPPVITGSRTIELHVGNVRLRLDAATGELAP